MIAFIMQITELNPFYADWGFWKWFLMIFLALFEVGSVVFMANNINKSDKWYIKIAKIVFAPIYTLYVLFIIAWAMIVGIKL